jgi:hypothetical protein
LGGFAERSFDPPAAKVRSLPLMSITML